MPSPSDEPMLGKDGSIVPKKVMAVLLWADAIERLDTLILEIRHIQANIAYTLRTGDLLSALRYEEPYLWGMAGGLEPPENRTGRRFKDWLGLLRHSEVGPENLHHLAELFVPSLDEASEPKNDLAERLTRASALIFDQESYGELRKKLEKTTKANFSGGQWGQDQRRNFYLYRALQRLKRNLLLSKLQLCWWGSWALEYFEKDEDGEKKGRDKRVTGRLAHFLTVRAAVMRKAHEGVDRLNDLQGQFERALDLGPQDHARPLGSRRRHGAVYGAFLHNRAHELLGELEGLLTDELRFQTDRSRSGEGRERGRGREPVMAHRWRHHFSSQAHALVDETRGPLDLDAPPPIAVEVISSSYWMPERPDLQAVIAHEAAISVLRRHINLKSSVELETAQGPFASLIRDIFHVMEIYRLDPAEEGSPFYRAPFVITTLAADLLACSVYGAAYVFALCQEIIGLGLERLFELPGGRLDVTLAGEVWRLRHVGQEIHVDWYLRLRLVSAWLQATAVPGERTVLGETLVHGVRRLADGLLAHLEELYSDDNKRWPGYWRSLTERICEIAAVSQCAKEVKAWRTGQFAEEYAAVAKDRPIWRADRAARPLPNDVATFLRQHFVSQKALQPTRALHKRLSEMLPKSGEDPKRSKIEAAFWRIYLGKSAAHYPWLSKAPPFSKLPIFRQVHDIPWEAAVIRAAEVLHHDFDRSPVVSNRRGLPMRLGPIATLHLDFSPGREAYQIGMEFQVLQAKRPHDRLRNAVRIIDELLDDNAPKKKSIEWLESHKDLLNNWRKPQSQNMIAELAKEIAEIAKKDRKNLPLSKPRADQYVRQQSKWLACRFSPIDLVQVDDAYRPRPISIGVDRPDLYVLHRTQGYKLQQLFEILGNRQKLPVEDPDLVALHVYLSGNAAKALEGEVSPRQRRFERLLDAMKFEPLDVPDELPESEKQHLAAFRIGEISLVSIGQSSEHSNDIFPNFLRSERRTVAALREHPEPPARHCACLGRFDSVTFTPAMPLMTYPLPVLLAPEGSTHIWERNSTDRQQITGESFFPFVQRRELGLKLRLPKLGPGEPKAEELRHFAVIGVALTQRYARLEFLGRLLDGLVDLQLRAGGAPEIVEHLGSVLQSGDHAYLTDGTFDLLLVFMLANEGPGPGARLHDVMRAAMTLHADFMVDRTETILFLPALEALNSDEPIDGKNVEKIYQLSQEIRLQERPDLGRAYNKLSEAFEGKIKGNSIFQSALQNSSGRVPAMHFVPGRADIVMNFDVALLRQYWKDWISKIQKPTGGDLLHLLSELGVIENIKLIDKVTTTIGLDPEVLRNWRGSNAGRGPDPPQNTK